MDKSYKQVLSCARALESDLRKLDIENLQVPEGVRAYYRFDIQKLSYVSECNAFILYHLVRDNAKPWNEISIIDHGTGIGFFAFLVKKMGALCICHDLRKEYLEGVKQLGAALSLKPDHYVLGDTDALVNYCKENTIYPDGLASRNVIEHIPDFYQLFMQLRELGKPGWQLLFSTSANTHNPMVLRIHRKIHHQYEYVGSQMDMDDPRIDAENCGMKIRSEIIRKQFPELDEHTVATLAENNRGYAGQHLLDRVQEYVDSGVIPSPLPHPTNTCDPHTGAWVERLVPLDEYKTAAYQAGFSLQQINGFYNVHYSGFLKRLVAYLLNAILGLKESGFIALSPFLAMKLTRLSDADISNKTS